MTESDDFDLIFPSKREKARLEEKIRKNKRIQNLWNFVIKSRNKKYFLQDSIRGSHIKP